MDSYNNYNINSFNIHVILKKIFFLFKEYLIIKLCKSMDFIKKLSNSIKQKILNTWNFKSTLFWNFLGSSFILINLIFFLIAIGLRNNNCVNTSFDLSQWLLLSTGFTLTMVLGSWMVNYIGNQGFWLSIINLIYHLLFINWLLLSAIGALLLIIFSNEDCSNKPEPIFIIVPLYLLIHNMIGGVAMSIFCSIIIIESIELYEDRNSALDDLII